MDPAGLAFALSAGALSFLSPCGYPLLPAYISYYLGEGDTGPGRAAVNGLAASAGFVLVYGLLFAIAALFGSTLLGFVAYLEVPVGLILIAMGGLMLSGRSPTLHLDLPHPEHRGILGFTVFGIIYAVAIAGCTAPIPLGLLAYALTQSLFDALLTAAAYIAGLAGLMVALTVTIAGGKQILADRLRDMLPYVERAGGAIMILMGFYVAVYPLL